MANKRSKTLFAAVAAALTLSLHAQPPAQQPNANAWVEKEVLIRLKPGFTADALQPMQQLLDTAKLQHIGGVPGTYLLKSNSKSTQGLLTALQNHPALEYVEANALSIRLDSLTAGPVVPNDPDESLPYLNSISAPAAWAYGVGASNVAIRHHRLWRPRDPRGPGPQHLVVAATIV